jgi:hypothetical protein
MRLENLYPNFGTSSVEDQAASIAAYRLRRAEDMAKSSSRPKRKSTRSTIKKPSVILSEEEKRLMKMLGLKQKDMLLLRASVASEIGE